jgi:truncated hemoglobin YjbI
MPATRGQRRGNRTSVSSFASEHFNRVAGHLTDSLSAAGVPEDTVEQILGAIAPQADEIATARSA